MKNSARNSVLILSVIAVVLNRDVSSVVTFTNFAI